MREQDAARILVILCELGTPATGADHCVLETEVYLQKLDYLVRCPADLAYVLLDRFESRRQQLNGRRAEVAGVVRRLVLEREPRLRTMGMQKFRFGPWERLDDVLAFLDCHDFVRVRPRSGQGGGMMYFVTKKGAALVAKLYADWSDLAYYRDKCNIIRTYLGDLSGTALKDYLYEVLQRIEGTKLGKNIPSHGDLVPPRFKSVMGEDL